jgi:hypothetical protein
MRRIWLLPVLVSLCGCAGFVVSGNQWKLVYADIDGRLPGIYVGGERGDFRVGTSSPSEPITDGWIVKKWGVPDQTIRVGEEVTYYYRAGVKMSGAIVGVGIMVPLMVPTGKEEYYFTFHDGQLVSARFEEIAQKGGAIGLPAHM